MAVTFPGALGRFRAHGRIPGWLVGSEKFGFAPLGEFVFVLENYEDDSRPEEFVAAMENFLEKGEGAIRGAEEHLFAYYLDSRDRRRWGEFLGEAPAAADVWRSVDLGGGEAGAGKASVHVRRRAYGNKQVYVLVEGTCAWDIDRGLAIVLHGGRRVSRVGGCDGHLSNADAFAMQDLEHIVYASSRHVAGSAWPSAGGGTPQQTPASSLISLPLSFFCCGAGF